MRVLVIEDNSKMNAAIVLGFTQCGWNADTASTVAEGLNAATHGAYDLVILDLALPDGSGVDLCRDYRRAGGAAKVLMLTASNGAGDRVAALNAGVDEYLTKPFELAELRERVRSLTGGVAADQPSRLRHGDIEFDPQSRAVVRGARSVDLTERESRLLDLLMRHAGRVLTKEQIEEPVWSVRFGPTSNVVDVSISALCRKLHEHLGLTLIHAIGGTGYRFGIVLRDAGEERAPAWKQPSRWNRDLHEAPESVRETADHRRCSMFGAPARDIPQCI